MLLYFLCFAFVVFAFFVKYVELELVHVEVEVNVDIDLNVEAKSEPFYVLPDVWLHFCLVLTLFCQVELEIYLNTNNTQQNFSAPNEFALFCRLELDVVRPLKYVLSHSHRLCCFDYVRRSHGFLLFCFADK